MKYSPEIVKKICDLIKMGNYIHTACDMVGISKETFYQWKEKKPDFLNAIKEAEAYAVSRSVALIQKAAQDGSWQAAAWYLERKHFADWGRKDKMELSGELKPLELVVVKVKSKEDNGES